MSSATEDIIAQPIMWTAMKRSEESRLKSSTVNRKAGKITLKFFLEAPNDLEVVKVTLGCLGKVGEFPLIYIYTYTPHRIWEGVVPEGHPKPLGSLYTPHGLATSGQLKVI